MDDLKLFLGVFDSLSSFRRKLENQSFELKKSEDLEIMKSKLRESKEININGEESISLMYFYNITFNTFI